MILNVWNCFIAKIILIPQNIGFEAIQNGSKSVFQAWTEVCHEMFVSWEVQTMWNLQKTVCDYSYRERVEKIGSITLLERKMRSDLIKALKTMEFLIMVDIFWYFSLNWNLLLRQISKTKSINQLDIFANQVIYFWNNILIKNNNSVKNFSIKLHDFRNNLKKKREFGGECWMNYLTEIDL